MNHTTITALNCSEVCDAWLGTAQASHFTGEVHGILGEVRKYALEAVTETKLVLPVPLLLPLLLPMPLPHPRPSPLSRPPLESSRVPRYGSTWRT